MAGPPAGAGDLPDNIDRALAARALAWLAQREYSRQELRAKLMRHLLHPASPGRSAAPASPEAVQVEPAAVLPPGWRGDVDDRRSHAQQVERVLDWLERHQHLSQRRFVESRLHARSERFGIVRIRQELAQHGVSIPAELDAALRESEFDRAVAVWQRKFSSRPTCVADAAKQARFLAGRGFTSDVVRRVLRGGESVPPIDPTTGADPEPSAPIAGSFAGTSDDAVRSRTGSPLRLVAGGLKKPAAG